jgi:hypothetical protein
MEAPRRSKDSEQIKRADHCRGPAHVNCRYLYGQSTATPVKINTKQALTVSYLRHDATQGQDICRLSVVSGRITA